MYIFYYSCWCVDNDTPPSLISDDTFIIPLTYCCYCYCYHVPPMNIF